MQTSNGKCTDLMPIDSATLLQVDATVMIGVFIFLTLRHLMESGEWESRWLRKNLGMVIPFALSAIFILMEGIYPVSFLAHIPTILTVIGFGYVIWMFTVLFIVSGVSVQVVDDRPVYRWWMWWGREEKFRHYEKKKSDD